MTRGPLTALFSVVLIVAIGKPRGRHQSVVDAGTGIPGCTGAVEVGYSARHVLRHPTVVGDEMRRFAVGASVAALAICALLGATVVLAAGQQRFPEGRYTSPLVAADFTHYGGQMDPTFPHPWIITIRGGRWKTTERPPFGGRYVLRGSRITFVVSYPANAAGLRQTLTWTYRAQRLRFKVVSGVEGGDKAIYLAHPWRRLGP
jgi:hypothetical protein